MVAKEVQVIEVKVALLARAWIEILVVIKLLLLGLVALLARAWIEILPENAQDAYNQSRSPCESVD